MTARWIVIEMPRADAAAATPAPATVPKLKKACMSGISVLPISRSASAPSTFIITSTAPLPNPKSTSPITTRGTDGRSDPPTPTKTRPTETVTSTPIMPARAPNRAISHGAAMRPSTDPAAPPRMTSPTPCVLRPVSSRTTGMRATQLAMLRPERKKIAKTALRHARSSRRGRAAPESPPRVSSPAAVGGAGCRRARPERVRRLGAATSNCLVVEGGPVGLVRAGGRLQCSRIDSIRNTDRRSDFDGCRGLGAPRHPLAAVTTMYGSPRRAP